jgi:CubicO group peptidase (beta-lactamase class C family)
MKPFSVKGLPIALVTIALIAGCSGSHNASKSTPSASQSASSAGAGRFPDPVNRPLPAAKVVALQAVLNRVVADYRTQVRGGFPPTGDAAPGLTAAVVSDQGVWSGAAGTGGDGAALTPTAMMNLASISKTFAAAEVLHLAAAGKVDLDAPLSKYVQHRLTSGNFTVRQALGMRSGLPDFGDADSTALLHDLLANCGRHWKPLDTLAYAKGQPSAPGTHVTYSSPNYLLLAVLIEKLTGGPLAAAYHADLIRPAGLDRIAVQDSDRPTPPLAVPPKRLHIGPADGYLPCRSVASATAGTMGGIAADAPTVARWGYQLYGARAVPSQTAQMMITAPTPEEIFPQIQYGLGTMIFSTLQLHVMPSVGHTGNNPESSTMLAVIPESHLSIALLVADEDKDTDGIMRKLFTALR